MSDNPKRAYLKIEMDLETLHTAITGDVPNVNCSLALAHILYRHISAQWEQANAPKGPGILPTHFVPPFKARPE